MLGYCPGIYSKKLDGGGGKKEMHEKEHKYRAGRPNNRGEIATAKVDVKEERNISRMCARQAPARAPARGRYHAQC
jgi:hypothetical protein